MDQTKKIEKIVTKDDYRVTLTIVAITKYSQKITAECNGHKAEKSISYSSLNFVQADAEKELQNSIDAMVAKAIALSQVGDFVEKYQNQ